MGILRKTREKVGNFCHGFLTIGQVAQKLGVDPKTVKSWCKTGKLPAQAKPYGKTVTYQVSIQALDLFLLQREQLEKAEAEKRKPTKPHKDYLPAWKKAMAGGLINGKVFSPQTIEVYWFYAEPIINANQTLTPAVLQNAMLRIPAKQFAKRLKVYESLVCFGRFLIAHNVLSVRFCDEVKPLRPKRHIPPKRTTIDQEGLEKMLTACESDQDRLIVTLLSTTGLRASEACALTWADIDLDKGHLTVQCGKGGKRRQVGINGQLLTCLTDYRDQIGKHFTGRILRDISGKTMTRHGLRQRIERIGDHAGIQATPHALRRAFVTLNANAGRPLQMLQMACGHSDIKTTIGYCRTSEQEVIEAMKGWD